MTEPTTTATATAPEQRPTQSPFHQGLRPGVIAPTAEVRTPSAEQMRLAQATPVERRVDQLRRLEELGTRGRPGAEPSKPAPTSQATPAQLASPAAEDMVELAEGVAVPKSQIADLASEAVRRNSLPAKPDDYKFEMGKDWVAPVGGEAFQLNADDPRAAALKSFAHKHRLSQDALSELIGIGASSEIANFTQLETAKAVEIEKLGSGPTATNRISAINTWLNGTLSPDSAKALQGALWTAGIVKAVEELISKSTGSRANFSQSGRHVAESGVSDETWNSWSGGQRINYSRTGDPNRAA